MAPLSGVPMAPVPGLLPLLLCVLATGVTLPGYEQDPRGLHVNHF